MEDDDDPLLGTTVANRYVVDRRIGLGGMGAVYLARQNSLGRAVALKVLRSDLLGDRISVERFKNEALVIARLGHPHIVGVHDFGATDDGVLYLAMEYLPGRTLAEQLRESGPFGFLRATTLLRDIVRALAAAHKRGIVHRDLKPDNIFLVEGEGLGDFVKVLDFGIAKLTRGNEVRGDKLTGSGFVPGTPGYIAPEQVTGSEDDPRSDLYAAGVTFFEMLTGRRPFEGTTAMQIFRAQLERDAPRLREVRPSVELPPAIEALLMSLLEREPDDRPASADALLEELAVLEREGVLTAPRLAHTPVSGSFHLEPIDPLEPDEPTLPESTTPATPVSVADASAEAPTQAPPVPAAEVSSSPRRLRTMIAAGALSVAAAALVLIGVALGSDGGWGRAQDGRNPLPVVGGDDSVRVELGSALESFYRGDLATAGNVVEGLRARAPDEPSVWFLRGVLDSRRFDWFASTRAFHRVRELVRETPIPPRYEGARALFETVPSAALGTSSDIVAAFSACAACDTTLLGHLVFSGLLSNAYTLDADEGLIMAERALALEPRAVLAHVDKVRFLISKRRGDEATSSAQEALDLVPRSPLLHQVAAEAFLAGGRYAEAERELGLSGMSVSGAGEIQRLRLWLLRDHGDDEENRRRHLAVTLQAAAPEAAVHVASDHAIDLVSAGRVHEASALFQGAVDDALAAGLVGQAALIVIDALKAGDAARSKALVAQMTQQAQRVIGVPEIPDFHRHMLAAILAALPGLLAADAGDLEGAMAALQRLEELESLQRLPIAARRAVKSYLQWRMLIHDPGAAEKAKAAAAHLGRSCFVDEALASITAAAGAPLEEQRRAWRAVLDGERYCRTETFAGILVLRAYVALAELEHRVGNVGEARALVERARASFPRADADLPASRALSALAVALKRVVP